MYCLWQKYKPDTGEESVGFGMRTAARQSLPAASFQPSNLTSRTAPGRRGTESGWGGANPTQAALGQCVFAGK